MKIRNVQVNNKTDRFAQLDSVRGIAALIVLFDHVLAANVEVFRTAALGQGMDSASVYLWGYTPLRLFWAGSEAVGMFFVLSGFVLTLQAKKATFRWSQYFPSRLVRLLLPVVATVFLFSLAPLFVDFSLSPENEYWFIWVKPKPYDVMGILLDFSLISGTSNLIGPLWSLQWEVIFSLLLPVYLFLTFKFKKFSLLVGFLAFSLGISTGTQIYIYLPIFLFGVWIAHNWTQVQQFFGFVNNNGGLWGLLLLFLSLNLIIITWLSKPLWSIAPSSFAPILGLSCSILSLLGICLSLIVAILWTPSFKLLAIKPLRALGTISFSLYLIHSPVIQITSLVYGHGKAAAVIELSASLIIAILFYFAIEKKTHVFSRRIRDSITGDDNQAYSNQAISTRSWFKKDS